MSETVWILMTVGAWILILGALSLLGNFAKQADQAQDKMLRRAFATGRARTTRPCLQLSGSSPTRRRGSRPALALVQTPAPNPRR